MQLHPPCAPPDPDPSTSSPFSLFLSFVKAFEGRPPDPDRDSTAAQAFYEAQDAAFAIHPLWAGAPPAVLEAAGEGLEKYVTTKIHAATFATAPLDVERDEALALRLRALSFVEPAHLDMPPSAVDERAVGLAGRELLKVNQFKVRGGEREMERERNGERETLGWLRGPVASHRRSSLYLFFRPPATSWSASSTAAVS